MYRSLVVLTILPLAFVLLWNTTSPDHSNPDKSERISGYITYQLSEATPTPKPTTVETPPVQTPTRQREPGLVAGAIIIAAIIIFGVLRYSRSK